ncbi:MAG TPA: DUF2304 domain-containing protein [Polyangia bacterium]
MIQFFLSGMLVIVGVYGARGWRSSRIVALGLIGTSAIGACLVWAPEISNQIAEFMGVGRGADLIFYTYITVSFLMILNLSLKLRHQHEITTRLVRYLAVRDARLPGAQPPPPPES